MAEQYGERISKGLVSRKSAIDIVDEVESATGTIKTIVNGVTVASLNSTGPSFTNGLATGHAVSIKTAVASVTCSGATSSASNLIPAGAIVLGVACRVTTLITGATSFTVGDGTDADRWGTGIAVAAGTTTTNAAITVASLPVYAAATSVVLTAAGSNFTAGVVRVTVTYIDIAAATS